MRTDTHEVGRLQDDCQRVICGHQWLPPRILYDSDVPLN